MIKSMEKPQVQEQGYDETPYTSYPFSYANPPALRAVAKLFAIDAPQLENCRVLELGGAEGTNILKFALDYPNSKCVGIDLSKTQIDIGVKRNNDLGLKNYELKHMSITDLDESLGKFDYIICHGVYSWVPDFVQKAILESVNKLLSDKGVAFISYNVYPGWNMQQTIRDLMVFHAKNFTNVKDKVAQARLALDFICETLENSDTPYAQFLKSIAKDLKNKKDCYLRHEYLADENKPCYYYQFVEAAKEHGLNYVGDTDIQRLFIGNLPEKARKTLSVINDLTKTEQYSDFISNPTFRCSVVTKNTNIPNRNIDAARLEEFQFFSDIKSTKEIDKKEVLNSTNMDFYVKNNPNLSVKSNSPELSAVIYTLMQANKPLFIKEIEEETYKNFPTLKNKASSLVVDSIIQLVFSGYCSFYSDPPKFNLELSEKPKFHEVNLYRLRQRKIDDTFLWLTTANNDVIKLEDMYIHILPYFDGNNTHEQIIEGIFQEFKNGNLTATENGKNITEEKPLRLFAGNIFKTVSEILVKNWLLVA